MDGALLRLTFIAAFASWVGALVFLTRAYRIQKAHFGWPKIGGLNFDLGKTGQAAGRQFLRGDYKGQRKAQWEALRREMLKAMACMASFAVLVTAAIVLGVRT